MIYNYCLYFIISLNILLINMMIYFIFILKNKFLKLCNKENVFIIIKEIKYELINDFELYSLTDIKETIEFIIKIYIDNKCDFNEDYHNKQKIYYYDIDIFIITKRNQIIEDIKNKLIINYNNDDYNKKINLAIS